MLKSTAAETSAKVSSMPNTGKTEKYTTDSKIEHLNFTIQEQCINETTQEPVSSLNDDVYTAKITSINKGKKNCEIHFILKNDGITGKIYVKNAQASGCKKGSKIEVTYQDGKPIHMKVK